MNCQKVHINQLKTENWNNFMWKYLGFKFTTSWCVAISIKINQIEIRLPFFWKSTLMSKQFGIIISLSFPQPQVYISTGTTQDVLKHLKYSFEGITKYRLQVWDWNNWKCDRESKDDCFYFIPKLLYCHFCKLPKYNYQFKTL